MTTLGKWSLPRVQSGLQRLHPRDRRGHSHVSCRPEASHGRPVEPRRGQERQGHTFGPVAAHRGRAIKSLKQMLRTLADVDDDVWQDALQQQVATRLEHLESKRGQLYVHMTPQLCHIKCHTD